MNRESDDGYVGGSWEGGPPEEVSFGQKLNMRCGSRRGRDALQDVACTDMESGESLVCADAGLVWLGEMIKTEQQEIK